MIAEAIAEFAVSNGRMFETDRSQTVGASEIGQCARKVAWLKAELLGETGLRDSGYSDAKGSRLRGRVFEDHIWVPAVRATYGDRFVLGGTEQKTFLDGYLSCTPDGMIVALPRDTLVDRGVPDLGPDGALVIDAKTIDPRAALNGPKPEHVAQVIVQLEMIRAQTRWKPEAGMLTYTDASHWDLTSEFAVRRDPEAYAHLKRRAREIMTTAPLELKPEGFIAGGKECGYCAFTKVCGRARSDVPFAHEADLDPQFVAEVIDSARAIKRAEANSDAATAALRTLQNDLKERLRAKKARRVKADGVTVLWSPVKGRAVLDAKALKVAAERAGIDLTPFETVGEPSDRLEIRGITP